MIYRTMAPFVQHFMSCSDEIIILDPSTYDMRMIICYQAPSAGYTEPLNKGVHSE